MANAATFFTAEQRQQVLDAVSSAELDTSGEVRVHLENSCKEDVLDHAAFIFNKLGMANTKLRNGVLFYLAVKDHKFAILGDAGINEKVPKDFWEGIRSHMQEQFRQGRFSEGLSEGIRMAGQQLKEHFPYQSDDVNELPDDISIGE